MSKVKFKLNDYVKFRDFYSHHDNLTQDEEWADNWDEQLRLVGYPSSEFISYNEKNNTTGHYEMNEDEFLMFALKWS
jgi:hypothetical protein